MVAKRRATVSGAGVRNGSKEVATKVSKQAAPKAAGPALVPAKTTDILSVLEGPNSSTRVCVGHIVEALPVSSPGLEYYLGEVVAMSVVDSAPCAYIHFLGEDSRMDDWLPLDRIRTVPTTSIERRLRVCGLNTPFFALSSFSASASSVHPRHHIKTVRGVQLGSSVVLKAWYPSPYPEMVSCLDSYVKVCDTCLSYFRSADEMARHWNYCSFAHPPGIEIYRDDAHQLSVFEIDGEAYNGYCERLLLLAKLFLEEKRACSQDASQYAQVRTFHFYVVCLWNASSGRADIVGYFSKLKNQQRESHILSCILVLPHQQRKGFGNFLIDLSYHLASIEGRIGSAERPLSELGQRSFYPYWLRRILPNLEKVQANPTIVLADLAQATGIVPDDVVEVLKHYGLLKEWGTAGVVVLASEHVWSLQKPPTGKGDKVQFDPKFLHWTPSYSLNST